MHYCVDDLYQILSYRYVNMMILQLQQIPVTAVGSLGTTVPTNPPGDLLRPHPLIVNSRGGGGRQEDMQICSYTNGRQRDHRRIK